MLLFHEVAQTAPAFSDQLAGMTAAGWIFMAIAWTTIISVAVFCYRKVLQKAAEKRQRVLREASPFNEQMSA